MDFAFDRFYEANRKIIIWTALFCLMWMMRRFFGLVFLTFVISFLAVNSARLIRRYTRLPHKPAIVVVYIGFLLVTAGFSRFVVPSLVSEGVSLISNIDDIQTTAVEYKTTMTQRYPTAGAVIDGWIRSYLRSSGAAGFHDPKTPCDDQQLVESFVSLHTSRLQSLAPGVVRTVWGSIGTLSLAMLFGFLISLDVVKFREGIRRLGTSRVRHLYDEVTQPIVRLAYVIGKGLQAQAGIASLNSCLTAMGLWLIGVPSILPLTAIVFLCGFIPVLGTFISTTPLVLVALNAGGLTTALLVVVMVLLVHTIETYVLNPFIYGYHMHLNPVLVLAILFVGHELFGVWGMLLGVPVTHYILHDILAIRPLPHAANGPDGEPSPDACTDPVD